MQISDLRREVRGCLLDFAWDEWAQMGVSATAERADRSAQDPEALLLFTLEVARADPRLLGEMLDWLALNERLVSVQRLRNLCRDDVDRALAEAALAWVAHLKDGGRRSRRPTVSELSPANQLFGTSRLTPGGRTRRSGHMDGWCRRPSAVASLSGRTHTR